MKFGVGSKFTGGWKIDGVDFADAQDAGVDAEIIGVTPENRKAHGLWIKNAKFTNIQGLRGTAGVFPAADAACCGYVPFFACSVTTTHVEQVVLDNVESDSSDCPMWGFGGDGYWIKNGNFHDSLRNGLVYGGIGNDNGGAISGATSVTPTSNLLVDSCTISNSGSGFGSTKGVAGIQISNGQDIIIQNSTFTLNKSNSADGVGIDIEGEDPGAGPGGVTIPATYLIQGNTLSSNQGAAFLNNQAASTGWNSSSEVLINSNFFTSNANNSLPAIMGMRTGLTNINIVWTNNNTTRAVNTQQKWAGNSTNTYTPLTNTTPTGYTYGASNTDHFP